MMNDAAGASKVRETIKQLPMEGLDEFAGKRFDTGGRLFWNGNKRADHEEACRITEAREQ